MTKRAPVGSSTAPALLTPAPGPSAKGGGLAVPTATGQGESLPLACTARSQGEGWGRGRQQSSLTGGRLEARSRPPRPPRTRRSWGLFLLPFVPSLRAHRAWPQQCARAHSAHRAGRTAGVHAHSRCARTLHIAQGAQQVRTLRRERHKLRGARSSPCSTWRPGGPSTRASSSPAQGRLASPRSALGPLVTCASLPLSDLAFLVDSGLCPPGGGRPHANGVAPAQPGPWRGGGRGTDWFIRQVIGGKESATRTQLARSRVWPRPRGRARPGSRPAKALFSRGGAAGFSPGHLVGDKELSWRLFLKTEPRPGGCRGSLPLPFPALRSVCVSFWPCVSAGAACGEDVSQRERGGVGSRGGRDRQPACR